MSNYSGMTRNAAGRSTGVSGPDGEDMPADAASAEPCCDCRIHVDGICKHHDRLDPVAAKEAEPTTPTGKRLQFNSIDGARRTEVSLVDILAIEGEAAAAERERLRARVIEHGGAGILTETEKWPLGIWLSPEDFLAEPSDD
jgi:hypothetical protein